MALPFVIVEGNVFITDVTGAIADIVSSAGKNRLGTQSTIVGGNAPYLEVDVEEFDNKRRLLTDSIVTVEQVFGFDDFADTWFEIVNAGLDGDSVRFQINAQNIDITTPDSDGPAIDVTINITATEAGDEIAVRDLIINTLNADPDFSDSFNASAIKDNRYVHISSRFIGEYGERPNPGDVIITDTGSVVTDFPNTDNDRVIRRGKRNSGSRDPRDRRLVTVGISGEVTTIPGEVGDLFIEFAENGASSDLRVDGDPVPVDFLVTADAEKDIFIREMRFFGGGNGIKFNQFLSKSGAGGLANGIEVTIKSDDQTKTLPLLRTTEDFKNKWAFGSGANSRIDVQAGGDQFLAVFIFESPFPLRKSGTFTTDDYIQVRVQDDISSGLQSLEELNFGFLREV